MSSKISDNKERITLTDNLQTACMKLIEGNPGAMNCLAYMAQPGLIEKIDPDNAFGTFAVPLMLDSFGIYGSNIYILWSDICAQDPIKFMALLRAAQLGVITRQFLFKVSNRQDLAGREMVDIDQTIRLVQQILPAFGKGA